MNTIGDVNKTGREESFKELRNILEPWVSDVVLINNISEDTNLTADLGLDSIGILHVILAVEEEFKISIHQVELESETFTRLSNLLNIIEQKINETYRPD